MCKVIYKLMIQDQEGKWMMYSGGLNEKAVKGEVVRLRRMNDLPVEVGYSKTKVYQAYRIEKVELLEEGEL